MRRGAGHRVPPSCQTRSARRRPRRGQRRPLPSDSRRGRSGRRGTMGPRAARTGLGPAAERERETGSGQRGRVAGEVPPLPGPGARLGADERGFPTADPTKTRGEPRPSPAWAAGRRSRRRWQVRFSNRPGGAIMGGGSPGPPHAGKSPLPAAARVTGPAQPRQPRGPALAPTRSGGGAGKHWEPREGGDAAKEKVGFGSVSFYRVGGAPVRAGARVAGRAGSRGPGPAGGALRSQGPSPRLGPG